MCRDRSSSEIAASAPGTTAEGGTNLARHALWMFILSLLASLVLRALYLAQPWRADQATFRVLLSDEGGLGLMIRDILEGARPVFMYGEYHQGALDAYLGAIPSIVFGKTLLSVRLTAVLAAVGSIGLTCVIAREIYGRSAGLLAASLVALPSSFVFLWGSQAQPGYIAFTALLLTVIYATLLVLRRPTWFRLIGLGFAAGLAGWENQLALPYTAACAVAVFLWPPVRSKHVAVALLAWTVGIAPLLYGNVLIPFASVHKLGRKAHLSIALVKPPADASRDDEALRSYRSLPLFEVLGAQQDMKGTWSVPGTLGAVVLVVGLIAGIRRWLRCRRDNAEDFRRHSLVLALVIVALGVGIAGFAGQAVGRYQLLLYPLLSVLVAGWAAQSAPRLAVPLIALILLGHVVTIITPPPAGGSASDDEIVRALASKGIRYGYSAGAMYDLVFRSGEQLVLVPVDYSRYTSYDAKVAAAQRICYVYRNDEQKKPAHEVFMKSLARLGVRYRQMDVGAEHHVLYDLEPRESITPGFIAEVRTNFFKVKDSQ